MNKHLKVKNAIVKKDGAWVSSIYSEKIPSGFLGMRWSSVHKVKFGPSTDDYSKYETATFKKYEDAKNFQNEFLEKRKDSEGEIK